MKKADKMFWSFFQNSPVHIAKRDDLAWWKGWIIRIISVVLALMVAKSRVEGMRRRDS